MGDRRSLSNLQFRGIAWLRDADVSVGAVADAFGITPGYVRVIHARSRHLRARRLSPNPAQTQPVRSEEDAVKLTDLQRQRVHSFMELAADIRERAEASWDLQGGVQQLKVLLQFSGFPASLHLIRLRATIREHLAWCQVHQRQTNAAFLNAREAFHLFAHLHRQTQAKSDLVRLGEISLIAAQACVTVGDSTRAARWHRLHEETHRASGERLNAEFFRQRGAAAVLEGRSEFAEHQFDQAGRAVEGSVAPWWKAHASQLQLAVITANWELAASAVDTIQSSRAGGLEEASAIVFARGAALSAASVDGDVWSIRTAEAGANLLAHFPRYHQLLTLLELADQIGWTTGRNEFLSRRRLWARFLLYQAVD